MRAQKGKSFGIWPFSYWFWGTFFAVAMLGFCCDRAIRIPAFASGIPIAFTIVLTHRFNKRRSTRFSIAAGVFTSSAVAVVYFVAAWLSSDPGNLLKLLGVYWYYALLTLALYGIAVGLVVMFLLAAILGNGEPEEEHWRVRYRTDIGDHAKDIPTSF